MVVTGSESPIVVVLRWGGRERREGGGRGGRERREGREGRKRREGGNEEGRGEEVGTDDDD